MEKKRPIEEIVGKCITKVEEHYKLKELYSQLAKGINVEEILHETVEDYKDKMKRYILELLEEMKGCREMVEALHGEQKKEVERDLKDCERELYCTLAELFELYHFFRELEQLSHEQLNEAVSIPIDVLYELLTKEVR